MEASSTLPRDTPFAKLMKFVRTEYWYGRNGRGKAVRDMRRLRIMKAAEKALANPQAFRKLDVAFCNMALRLHPPRDVK